MLPTPALPTGLAPGLRVSDQGVEWCAVDAGGQSLRWADSRAALEIPAGAIAAPVCIIFGPLDTASLPAAPAGYALAQPAGRLLFVSADGTLSRANFLRPVTLTLSYADPALPEPPLWAS